MFVFRRCAKLCHLDFILDQCLDTVLWLCGMSEIIACKSITLQSRLRFVLKTCICIVISFTYAEIVFLLDLCFQHENTCTLNELANDNKNTSWICWSSRLLEKKSIKWMVWLWWESHTRAKIDVSFWCLLKYFHFLLCGFKWSICSNWSLNFIRFSTCLNNVYVPAKSCFARTLFKNSFWFSDIKNYFMGMQNLWFLILLRIFTVCCVAGNISSAIQQSYSQQHI